MILHISLLLLVLTSFATSHGGGHHHHHHKDHHSMNERWFIALIASLLVSLISLVGALLLKSALNRSVILFLTSLAVGSMLGDTFLHILPSIYEHDEKNAILYGLMIFCGFIVCLVLEIAIRLKQVQLEGSHKKDDDRPRHHHHHHIKAFGWLNLIGDGIHNFIDGVGIAASFATSTRAGIANTIAIMFHELPQELSDFGVLIKAGFQWKSALLWNLISGLIAVLGCAIAIGFGATLEGSEKIMMCFTAGGFIYIAAVDMLPDVLNDTMKKNQVRIV